VRDSSASVIRSFPLHDALPISDRHAVAAAPGAATSGARRLLDLAAADDDGRHVALRVPGQNAERARSLELGPLPGPLEQAPPPHRADHARLLGRGAD